MLLRDEPNVDDEGGDYGNGLFSWFAYAVTMGPVIAMLIVVWPLGLVVSYFVLKWYLAKRREDAKSEAEHRRWVALSDQEKAAEMRVWEEENKPRLDREAAERAEWFKIDAMPLPEKEAYLKAKYDADGAEKKRLKEAEDARQATIAAVRLKMEREDALPANIERRAREAAAREQRAKEADARRVAEAVALRERQRYDAALEAKAVERETLLAKKRLKEEEDARQAAKTPAELEREREEAIQAKVVAFQNRIKQQADEARAKKRKMAL